MPLLTAIKAATNRSQSIMDCVLPEYRTPRKLDLTGVGQFLEVRRIPGSLAPENLSPIAIPRELTPGCGWWGIPRAWLQRRPLARITWLHCLFSHLLLRRLPLGITRRHRSGSGQSSHRPWQNRKLFSNGCGARRRLAEATPTGACCMTHHIRTNPDLVRRHNREAYRRLFSNRRE